MDICIIYGNGRRGGAGRHKEGVENGKFKSDPYILQRGTISFTSSNFSSSLASVSIFASTYIQL